VFTVDIQRVFKLQKRNGPIVPGFVDINSPMFEIDADIEDNKDSDL